MLRPMDDTPEARKAIGARIEKARLGSGHENASLFARKCGVTPNTLYRWESGEVVPTVFNLASIAEESGVQEGWLLRGDEAVIADNPVLREWLARPRNAHLSPAAVAFLENLPLNGAAPTLVLYDYALVCFEQGLNHADAALASRYTSAKKKR